MISASSARPATAIGLARKSLAIRRSGDALSARRASGAASTGRVGPDGAHVPALRQPHTWIEQRIQDVDQQVDDDEERHDHEQVRDDHRPVEQVDRVDQELAHAGPCEHALGDDRERDQRAELQADDGDDRNQNVAQHVHADDARVRQAFRARELDVVLQQRLVRAGAREADQQATVEQREVGSAAAAGAASLRPTGTRPARRARRPSVRVRSTAASRESPRTP